MIEINKSNCFDEVSGTVYRKSYLWGNIQHPFSQYMMRMVRYREWLSLKKDFPLIMLTQSLEKDGRFYGADMTLDGYDTLDELRGCLSFLNDGKMDSVEIIREIRDRDYYDE